MEGSSSVRAISECFIKPKHVVEESKKAFYLGSFELKQISHCYLQRGLLYDKLPTKEEGGIDLFLIRLKQSLSSTLAHFYPLAGQLVTKVDEDEHNSFIFIDCNKGRGVKFIHATSSDVAVQDITSSIDKSIPESFFDFGRILTNYDSHDEPILVIQVTELIDGIFIGVSVNHSVVDGNSYWHFMSSWSEIYESNDAVNISRVPILERWFPEGYGPIIKIPYTNPEEFITRYDQNKNINNPLKEMILPFSRASLEALKAKANADCNAMAPNKISSFQALSALLWRSIARSRCLKSDENIICIIIVDCRSRVKPPLSSNYFGSFIDGIVKFVKVGELLGNNLGWGASLLHQGVHEWTDEHVHKEFVEWIKAPYFIKQGESNPNIIVIGGSPRADAYNIKFGLGEPVTIRVGSDKIDGRVCLEPGKDGKGSIALHIWLSPHTFTAFQEDSELLSFCSPSCM